MAEPHALLADRYRLVREVGRGGMGVVWEAWDERLERPVAVKELRPQLGLSPEEAELAKNRAMREARITARLHHRNAVPVFDVVEHEGQPCLIMQFLPSVPLSAVLREGGPLGVHEAARFGAEVASALAAAHALGIVHRDVKPGNILIADDGTALISDFGISHALGDATLTSTGLVHGTPAYLAPEVARGAESSFASDVFSLGATLYACLQGAPPFGTDSNSIALLYRVASGEFAPPERGGAMTPVLLEMLQADPAARPTMKEAAGRLAAIEAGEDVSPATRPLLEPVTTPAVAPDATGTTRVRRDDERPTVAVALPAASTPVVAEPTAVEPAAVGSSAAVEQAPVGPPAPPSSPDARPGRRSRGRRVGAIALLIGLVVLGTILALGQLRGGGDATVAAPGTSAASTDAAPTGSEPTGADATPTSTATDEASDSPSDEPSDSASDEPSDSPSPSTSATTRSPSPSPTSGSGEPSRAELADAITGYYALVPDDTDAAWRRLTSDYQRSPSGGRQSYDSFWDKVDRVSVSKVDTDPPFEVKATVTFRRTDGTVEVDRTRFRLVREDGILKIAGSSVLSSS